MINFKTYLKEREEDGDFTPEAFRLYKHASSFNPGMISYSFFEPYEVTHATKAKEKFINFHKFSVVIHAQLKYKIMDIGFNHGNVKITKKHIDLVVSAILDAINHLRFKDNYTIRFRSSNLKLIQNEIIRKIPKARNQGDEIKVGDSLEVDSHKERLDNIKGRLKW